MSARPPARASRPPAGRQPAAAITLGARVRALIGRPWRPWFRAFVGAVVLLAISVAATTAYFWVTERRRIEAKLGGEERPVPRVFGRPFTLHAGDGVSETQFIARLNDVAYAQRPKASAPGEFSVAGASVLVGPRSDTSKTPHIVRVDFSPRSASVVSRLSVVGGGSTDELTLEAPLLAALAPGERRRYVPLSNIPRRMIDAVIAIEDHRFYEHPGVDPIGALGALVTNLRGNKPYLAGGSTITQQIVKNTFLTPEKTIKRKLQEQFMAVVLESRFTKNQILELYLNDVVLGQRGPFEIHGVSEAARIFFEKDVSNISLAEAATIAGLIQSPSRLSPFRNPERARERRNVVLKEMSNNGFITEGDATKAAAEPLVVSNHALEDEAPYFVDYVSQLVDEQYGGLLKKDAAVDVYTTLDLRLQRMAEDTVADGMKDVDKQLAAHKKLGQAQVSLVAVDPKTGQILAFVGGRAYTESQYDRAAAARRQPGSVFKPFVYLTAFEQTAADNRLNLTPATVITDEPTTFKDGTDEYTPSNYQNEYDGPITLRRALAFSRNIVAIKVAEAAGYDHVAALWQRVGVGTPAKAYPSIALGVFEASPLEMTEAYTLFTNGGSVRPLQAITRLTENGTSRDVAPPALRNIARPDTTYLVTNMLRSVLDEGTGASARAAGFTADAAGKTGTTNDLRDAWFIGFTPDLLTAVWVGFDNNQPIGLSGAQAALPIWTAFMKRARAGKPDASFDTPGGIVFESIDKDTGQLATPNCPHVIREAFLTGTEPTEYCQTHGGGGLTGFLSRIGALIQRVVH